MEQRHFHVYPEDPAAGLRPPSPGSSGAAGRGARPGGRTFPGGSLSAGSQYIPGPWPYGAVHASGGGAGGYGMERCGHLERPVGSLSQGYSRQHHPGPHPEPGQPGLPDPGPGSPRRYPGPPEHGGGGYAGRYPGLPHEQGAGGERPGGGTEPPSDGRNGVARHRGAALGPLYGHESGPAYKVKRIVVDPGKRLSLQMHHQRAEHWVVVQGTALVTIGRELRRVTANESVFVPLHTAHRLENPGSEPLAIIEVQTGAYLEEDDIVRLDDDFWRQTEDSEDKIAGESKTLIGSVYIPSRPGTNWKIPPWGPTDRRGPTGAYLEEDDIKAPGG